jgi:hypothetical protein
MAMIMISPASVSTGSNYGVVNPAIPALKQGELDTTQ